MTDRPAAETHEIIENQPTQMLWQACAVRLPEDASPEIKREAEVVQATRFVMGVVGHWASHSGSEEIPGGASVEWERFLQDDPSSQARHITLMIDHCNKLRRIVYDRAKVSSTAEQMIALIIEDAAFVGRDEYLAIKAKLAAGPDLVDPKYRLMMSEAISMQIHDIRNPLTLIVSYTQLIKNEAESEREAMIRQIKVSAGKTRTVADRTEEFLSSPFPQGRIGLERFRRVLGRTDSSFTSRENPALYEFTRQTGEINGGLTVDQVELGVPEVWLDIAVSNIVSNSRRATENEPGVARQFFLYDGPAPEAGYWEIRARDTGPGFSQNMLEGGFRLGVTENADRGGSGTAMAVCKEVFARYGARMEISNWRDETGSGAQTRILIPILPTLPAES